jgi:spermidine/putrescine transport system permease protein
MLLFLSMKVRRSIVTLTLAHITFCIPYVILSVLPKLRQLDDNVAEAAMDLGATPWKALIKVILPQIYPAILSGALIAFSMSFDDFVISYFTAGMDVQNISMYVYSMKRFNPAVNALSAVIVIVVTVILVLANLIPYLRNKKMNKEEQ